MIRIVPLLCAALIAVPCSVVTVSRVIGGASRSPIPEFAAFAPWSALGWIAVLLLLLSARRWWVALVVLALIAVQLTWVLPTRSARAAADHRPGALAVRVLTINVLAGRAEVAQILRVVESEDVDLLVIQEAEPQLVSQLDSGVGTALPHSVRSNPSYAIGTVLWSRWPLTHVGPAQGVGGEIVQAGLQVPGAVPVTITGVHTISPGRGRIERWNRDLETLARVSTQTAKTSPAQVLLGDFNATRDHRPFRELLETGLVDGAEAVRSTPWAGVTWPANKRPLPLLVRLDHVLVTPKLVGVAALRSVLIPGTDHLGLLAILEIAPTAG